MADNPVAKMTDAEVEADWAALWARVELSLDEREMETYRKHENLASRRLKKAGLEEAPVDLVKLKRAGLAYAIGVRGKRGLYPAGLHDAMSSVGMTTEDYSFAANVWPQIKFVVQYVQKVKAKGRELRDEDAKDRLHDLVLEKAETDSRVLMFAAERLDKKAFGNPRDLPRDDGPKRGGVGGGGVMINIVGDAASVACEQPKELGGKAAVFIDV